MRRLRFGVFEADLETGELTRSGRRVALPRQSFQVLTLLAESSGRLVTRGELRRHLWSDGTFVGFEHGLNFCVNRLRVALGDDARVPRYVETLPRRGYRFICPVEVVSDEPAPAPSEAEASHVERTPQILPAASGGAARARDVWPRLLRTLAAALFLASQGGLPQAHSRDTANSRARLAFERGLAETRNGVVGRRRSLAFFEEAARRDPRFAEAHYAIADIYLGLGEQGQLAPRDAFPAAGAAAERAVALEDVADTRLILGSVRLGYDWNWNRARREFERAVELAPHASLVLAAYARYLSAAGEHERAIETIGRAEAVNPSCDVITNAAAEVLYRARRFDEAIRKARTAVELGPPRSADPIEWRKENLFLVFRAHLAAGALREARSDAQEIVRLSGASADVVASFAAREPADAVSRFLRGSLGFVARAAEREYVPPVRFAQLHALLGEDEKALDWLDRAARERAPSLVYALVDPDFDALRGEPRFQRLLTRVGSPLASRPRSAAPILIARSEVDAPRP